MAQKRNPVSLRLQTRLQGNEKRFASCWFTDSFFPQVYTNDLVKRLYLGHLLQKGGSWYGEVSESRVPETCISIQFLYRRCSILSVVLDRRKEEYILSTPLKRVKVRREEIAFSSQTEAELSRTGNKEEISSYKGVYTSLFSPCSKKHVFTDKIAYLSIANYFGGTIATHKCNLSAILTGRLTNSLSSGFAVVAMPLRKITKQINGPVLEAADQVKTQSHLTHPLTPPKTNIMAQTQWRELLYRKTSCHYNLSAYLPTLSTIESICDLSQKNRRGEERFIREIDTYQNHTHQPFTSNTENHSAKNPFDTSLLLRNFSAKTSKKKKDPQQTCVSSFTLSSHWTSLSIMRGVSAYQSVEFCLSSVLFLCQKRVSFLKIKDTLFQMLALNETIRGARLVYSGRQGGRSKSAMRAKKQSALWGETALSLFSSRLAFASAGVDTSFGQIGIKLWICYK